MAYVPTRNRSAALRQGLASIRALEGPDLQFELIVVDNGSSDDSLAVARSFGATVLETSARGAAAARNVGLRAATAPFVAFLDDDDVWLPQHIRPHLALLQQRPEVMAVTGQIVLADAELCAFGSPCPTDVTDDRDMFVQFLGQYPQLGATVARTGVRDSVGYMDPDVEGDEDWDWHLRLSLRHPVGFVALPCMLFRQRPLGSTATQEWLRLRNTRRVFVRNMRRAGKRRPSLARAIRLFLGHNGHSYAYFVAHAFALGRAGQRHAGWIAVWRAVRCSPAHTLFHIVHPGSELVVALKVLLGAAS